MMVGSEAYPVRFEVDGPAPQGRLSILLRGPLVIPHAVALAFAGLAAGIAITVAWFAILFTGRVPAGLTRFTIGFSRWAARANAYGSLLTGRYPPFSVGEEPDYPVRLIIPERTADRNRLTALFRCLLLLPHEIVLSLLGVVLAIAMPLAWLAGIALGRIPEGLHAFLAGYTAWTERASAYGYLLVDEYPPFSLR